MLGTHDTPPIWNVVGAMARYPAARGVGEPISPTGLSPFRRGGRHAQLVSRAIPSSSSSPCAPIFFVGPARNVFDLLHRSPRHEGTLQPPRRDPIPRTGPCASHGPMRSFTATAAPAGDAFDLPGSLALALRARSTPGKPAPTPISSRRSKQES